MASGLHQNQEKCLIDLGNSADNRNHGYPPPPTGPSGGGSNGGGSGGFGTFSPPPLPSVPPSAPYPAAPSNQPIGFNFENAGQEKGGVRSGGSAAPPPHYDSVMRSTDSKPKPLPRTQPNPNDSFPELPSVPNSNLPDIPTDDPNGSKDEGIDFDDLTKRFEDLKKRK